jgi:hypothetical protein
MSDDDSSNEEDFDKKRKESLESEELFDIPSIQEGIVQFVSRILP